jgi:transposase InsO family protein
MVTPNQKRLAVLALVDEFGVSQRRACLVVGQHRSMQRRCLVRSSEEMGLRQRIRALAVKYPRYGYRRVHVMLIRDGYQVNRKRVQRLWRLEGGWCVIPKPSIDGEVVGVSANVWNAKRRYLEHVNMASATEF